MKLRQLMTPDPLTLSPGQSVAEALTLFIENMIDGAPVTDESGKLIGLFTKRHIYRAIDSGMDMSTRVEYLMTRQILTGHPDDEFGQAINPTVPRLPVVDEQGKPVGIITRGDIAKVFFYSYNNMSLELDTIINSTHNMIVSIDETGMIKVCNPAAEKIFRMKAEDVIGKNITELLPESNLIDIIKTGEAEPMQKVNLRGVWFISNRSPIIKEGKIIGAVAVLQDISDLDKMSKELRYVKELNEELDAIVESSFDGLFITDGAGVVLRYNKAFEQLTGINAHEYLGRTVEDIRTDGIISDPVTIPVLEHKKPITLVQESKTGKITLTTGNPVVDKNGNIIRVVCNVRDLTELNMLRQKLEQVQGLSQHYESQLRTLRLRYTSSEKMVVTSTKMRNLIDTAIRLAAVESTILVTGESGTGKELIAEVIHASSSRNDKPLVKVNCGAIPENLMESELFGYEGGAFTGAKKEGKAGYFELAAEGTLFLDEIGDVPLNLQVKLLRFLQNKEMIRVGGESYKTIDVRIIAATNRDLLQMVQTKQFREDLFYRLNVVPINTPPLRDRKEDIPSLVAHFIHLFNRKYQMNKIISPGVIDIFMEYNWPGNVRELENLIERLVVITPQDIVCGEDLPSSIKDAVGLNSSYVMVSGIVPLKDAIESVEKQLIERAYAKFRTTRQMAKELQVDAATVVRKAAKYHISKISQDN
ncbi:MAG TPA: sigma 54-interacting transcriptional regulator [Syntrophomonadaceae bacterium]|nr:sigma 54-interacting transcriptional regulator [Syntrophomonadaceae bacterium]